MKCNGCWNDVEVKAQCVATHCGHLFCESPGISSFALLHAREVIDTLTELWPGCVFAICLVGLKCAQSILESDESACLICENLLTKR